ncbi:MAG: ABC transporter substrate-binding protein [Alphaproteobacteria bacterium]|nr:ABC transporter substrate-binding protein [Alphaproteobacteria bacterium]
MAEDNDSPRNGRAIGRRTLFRTGGAVIAGGLAAPAIIRPAFARDTLYVNTWGGSWTENATKAFFDPFGKANNVEVRTLSPVSFAKLKAQVETRAYEWDVTTQGLPGLARASKEGLLEPLDESVVDKSKLAPDSIRYGCIASHALSTCLVYRTNKFPNGGPQSWADFWDVKKFPGNRSLQKEPGQALAFALLADGVPKDKLYPFDLDRAFKKLDQIKPHIKVWWTQGSQSQQLLRDGEVDMMSMWNGRAVELIDDKVPAELVWNEAEMVAVHWVVVKGTPRAKLAWRFVQFAHQPEPLAKFANTMNYGPLNPKSFDFIPEAQAKRLPTWPANAKVSFVPDAAWLGDNLNELARRFNQWVAT